MKLTYQQKINEAARNWLVLRPDSDKSEAEVAAEIAKNNINRCPEACDEFDYSGTRWCDRCGHESEAHVQEHMT